MGSYRVCYEEYYNNFNRRKNLSNIVYKKNKNNFKFYANRDYIIKIFIRHLVGTLCLFILALSLKLIVTPKTQAIYIFCKNQVNREYSIDCIMENIKSINIEEIKEKIIKRNTKIKEFSSELEKLINPIMD